jgi:hypothetical protein
MRILKTISALSLLTGLLFGNFSCIMVKSDNGRHLGWYKNRNNPHHPLSTNPGHTKKVVKSKGAPAPVKNNGRGKK